MKVEKMDVVVKGTKKSMYSPATERAAWRDVAALQSLKGKEVFY
jgi:hypothetical protein